MSTVGSRSLFVFAATVLLAGCASRPDISLDKTKTEPIGTVALLRVSESQNFVVRNLSGLKALGGAIGGAIAGGGDDKRTATLVDSYNRGAVRLSALLINDLSRELASGGMQVSYTPDEFAKLKGGTDDYSHIKTEKDAILSVWFGSVGYVADGVIDAPYEPWVVLNVRLLHGKTKQVLSQKTYSAGFKSPFLQGAVFVPCSAGHRFDTFEKLTSDFKRAVDGLAECESAIIQRAAQDIK